MQTQELFYLKQWFLSQKRDLPWRENTTPYGVWVSEVMLQQTQVSVVIPYFLRWMEQFPTIEALARAPIEAVLKEWEGLGYYSRARNLHEGARYIFENYKGELPCSADLLQKIKGIGPYTVGAILSFAFHQKAAAVDGNVLRVLARYYALSDDISKPKTVKKIRTLAQELLPDEEPWIISEALIELGATICARNPKCVSCPLQTSCQGFLTGQADTLPVKSEQAATTSLIRTVAVIVHEEHILLKKGAKGKLMADLYEFPYVDMTHAEMNLKEQKELVEEALKLNLFWQKTLPQEKHTFTRYRALLLPHVYKVPSIQDVLDYEWHSLDVIDTLPFSSGHRRILSALKQSTTSTIAEKKVRELNGRINR